MRGPPMGAEPWRDRIERMTPEGWERVRAVRLRALRDAPDAFGTTFEEDEARPPESWRERLAGSSAVTFLATAAGQDVGLVVGAELIGRERTAGLFGMWVAPEARGTGVGDRLATAVIEWAQSSGYERLVLEVGDANTAAIGLYERMGFAPTGVTGTLPPPRAHIGEHERMLRL